MKLSLIPISTAFIAASAHAIVYSDFTFNDAGAGLDITDATNSGTTGGTWNQDVGEGTSVSGGKLSIGDLSPNTFGNQSYTSIGDTTFRQANDSIRYLVLEDVQVDFEGASNGSDRYAFGVSARGFTGNDNELSSIWITRGTNPADLTLEGYSEGTGGLIGKTTIGPGYVVNGGPDTTALFDFVMAIDMSTDTYEIFWREGTNAFASIGSAALNTVDPDGSETIYIDNAGLSSGGENMSVDRIYFTDVNPIPEPSAYALISGILALSWIMVRRRK